MTGITGEERDDILQYTIGYNFICPNITDFSVQGGTKGETYLWLEIYPNEAGEAV